MTRRSVALAALSGLLLALTFPVFDFAVLAWVALVPLLTALRGRTVRQGFWLGGITGLVFFAGTVNWVTHSMYVYGGIPLIPASLVTLSLSAYLAVYPALFGAAVVHIRNNRPALVLVAAPALWTALELARTYVFSGFPWVLLGYSQYRALPVIQIADITAVYGVSFLLVFVNTALAAFLEDRRRCRGLAAAALLTGLVLLYGFVRLGRPQGPGAITISVVQGNIEQDKKWDPAYQSDTTSVYERLTREALKDHPALVVWPETATPFYFGGDNPADAALTADLEAFVKENKVPLLFGSPTYEVRGRRNVVLHNSAFLLSGDGAVIGHYDKIHLVPFGEYVPLKNLLFFVGKMVQAIGDFEPGRSYTVMTVPDGRAPDVKVSTVICYEVIFPDLVRKFVDRGATVITNITNDAWFGRTAAPYQHFSMAVFRAVENRVPVARAANTGISGFIDARGRILAESSIFTEAYLTHTLVPGSGKTFYTRFGDLFAYACLALSLTLIAITPRRKNR